MAYNKSFKPKAKDYMDDAEYHSIGTPSKEGNVDDYISRKMLKDAPKSSYSVKADPYDASLPTSIPYALLAPFNKKAGGHYGGFDNIDGGNVSQYSNSLYSKFLSAYDFIHTHINLNYRFRPIVARYEDSTHIEIGTGLVDQCRQAIAEAVSVLSATTFTQMNIYHYVVETDMEMGSAETKTITVPDGESTRTATVYANINDVIYSTTTYYQLVLQEVLTVLNFHNSFRLKMGTMIRSSWNRETPVLNSLFGLFKKKAFLSSLDSLCLSIPGEYVDTEWMKQVNTLCLMPSRRSNSLLDPVLELSAGHVMPTTFRIFAVNDDGEYLGTAFDQGVDLVKRVGLEDLSFKEICDRIIKLLTAEDTMFWARNNMTIALTDQARYNSVNYLIASLQLCMTSFKTSFNDVREVLDVLQRTGVVTWTKGFRPSIVKDTDAALFDNSLVNDIFQTIFSGAHKLNYNVATKRWRTFSLWNMYTGIPEYDAKSGGAFLSFSFKDIDITDDSDGTYKYLPIAFLYDATVTDSSTEAKAKSGVVCKAVSRDGIRTYIKAAIVTMAQHTELERLVPLPSQNTLQIRAPRWVLSEDIYQGSDRTITLDSKHQSLLLKQLCQVFNIVDRVVDNVSYYMLETDIVATYQIEIEDVTNDAIAYARATGPFKGSVGYESKLGFNTYGQTE